MGELNKRFPRYSKLLGLYPLPYRRRYSSEMLQTLADMLDNATTSRERLAIWLRVIFDLPLSLSKENIVYIGGTMTHETPNYVKYSSLVGGSMLLPFFLLVAAQAIDKNIRNSSLWHYHALFTCFVILPALACILAATAFISWLAERHHQEHKSWLQELFDIRRNWPLLAVAVIGFGIIAMVFGHDSVQCVTGNPIRELRNFHQTTQCIQQGR